jgi:hypothetical protein
LRSPKSLTALEFLLLGKNFCSGCGRTPVMLENIEGHWTAHKIRLETNT